ncbi:MAG: Ig-like domain-containing protein [Sulfurovaceae bacterium]|nr:Ig-like domain-containing protein [Sulfurovaceae bacterium]
MSKEIAVIVKDGQNAVSNNVVMEGSGATGKPLVIKAGHHQAFEFKNLATGVAPDQIHVTKHGKDLHVKFGKKANDTDNLPDVIIEGYDDNGGSIVGVAENGQYYNFIAQGADPADSYYSLGGDVITSEDRTDWLPLALGTLAAAALAAAIGGGGGGDQDTTPPDSLTVNLMYDNTPITGPITTGTFTNDTTPVISGNTEAGATVTAKDDAGHTLGTATADNNGNYSITPTTELSEGQHYISVTAADAAGNDITVSSVIFTVDTTAPNAPIVNPTDGSPITGTAEAGSTVTITVNGNPIGTTTADNNGNFTYTPSTPVPNGIEIEATATDAAGNVSDPGTTIVNSAVPDAPMVYDDQGTIQGYVANNTTTDDTKPTIEGSGAGAGRSINVYDNGVLLGTTTSDVSGNWSIEPSTPFANGSEHSITYTVNSGPLSPAVNFTVDTSAPTASVNIGAIATDSGIPGDFITNDNTLIFSGTNGALGAGEKVQISLNGGTTWVDATQTDATHWSYNNTAHTMAEGSYTVEARVVDAAGNIGNIDTQEVIIDRTAPTATTNITTITTDTDTVGDFITSDNTLIIGGTNTAMNAGEKVQVSFDGGTTWVDATQNTSTTWSYDNTAHAMTVGSHTLESRVIDTAGNVGAADTQSLTIAPPSVIDLGPGNGQLIDPVYVDGNYYYYWDKNENGLGMVNGNPDAGDQFTHNELDAMFKYDVNGNLRPSNLSDTNDTYRYDTINGYHLALPTDGIGAGNIEGPHNGTAIDNVPAGEINPTYDDLLAIWDAYNGSGTEQLTSGVPTTAWGEWAEGIYWSATAYGTNGHSAVDLLTGSGVPNAETNNSWVAVQVIF